MLMPHKNSLKPIKSNEQGFASMVIALILIIILALLTIGFAQLARREQQNALDKQLANQAYYAAETGVNDAHKDIKSGAITIDGTGGSTTKADKTNCIVPVTGLTKHPDIDANNGVFYTCLLVDLTPVSLTKDLGTDTAWNTTFSNSQSSAPTTLVSPGSLTVTWSSQDGKSPRPPDGTTNFTPVGPSWNAPAVLQVSLTPLNQLDRASLISSTYTVFLYPSRDSGSAVYSTNPIDQGKIVPGSCGGSCQVTISGLPAGVTSYLLRMIDYYDDSHVIVTAKAADGITPLDFNNSQAVIDSTGRARNVLKRIRVHVPANPPPNLPNNSLDAQNICKYFTTDPSGTQSQSSSLSGYPPGFDVTKPCSLN